MTTIKIMQDLEPQDPREWDNIGTMACWHRRYDLGDTNGPELLKEAVRADKSYKEAWDDYGSNHFKDLDDPKTLVETAKRLGFVMLPLYLYDHSGLTMNTTGFRCPWDSGQVGVIFATRKKVREEYSAKKVGSKILERVKKYLRGEVETYDQYLRGVVYGFKIVEVDEDGDETEVLDSCWGFYGDDPETNGMKDYWPEELQNSEPEFEAA